MRLFLGGGSRALRASDVSCIPLTRVPAPAAPTRVCVAVRRVHYYAYGSNMNIARMQARCPSAEPVGTATLEGWRLAFALRPHDRWYAGAPASAPATIVPDYAGVVHGVVWTIAETDLQALDRAEGVPFVYRRVQLAQLGLSYMLPGGGDWPGAPTPEYLALIREGYATFGLDTSPLDAAVARAARAAQRQVNTPWTRWTT